MARKKRKSNLQAGELNLTAMIDIAFQLLYIVKEFLVFDLRIYGVVYYIVIQVRVILGEVGVIAYRQRL